MTAVFESIFARDICESSHTVAFVPALRAERTSRASLYYSGRNNRRQDEWDRYHCGRFFLLSVFAYFVGDEIEEITHSTDHIHGRNDEDASGRFGDHRKGAVSVARRQDRSS